MPDEVKSISEIPDNYNPQSLGRYSDIIKVFVELLPTADSSDTNWGVLDTDEYSIEINIGDNKYPVESKYVLKHPGERLTRHQVIL